MYLFFLFAATLALTQHFGEAGGYPTSTSSDVQKYFILKDFQSTHVTAYKTDMSCGEETTEYHVVHYNGLSREEEEEDDDDEEKEDDVVRVVLRPENNQTFFGKLVLVLGSNVRVTWKVNLRRVFHDSPVHLLVSGHSKILKEHDRSVGIRYFPYTKGMGELRTLVREEFGDVKFSPSIVRSNAVNIKTTSGGDVCQMKPSQVVPLAGCVMPWNAEPSTMKFVYVIEAIDPNPPGDPWSSRDHPPPVKIHLYPKNGKSMKVHVQLVLRSSREVNWVLQANKLKGMLDLIAEQQGNTVEVNLRNTRFVHEKLSDITGEKLIEWVEEKYQAPVAYVYARGANSFQIALDPDFANASYPSETLEVLRRNLIVDCQDTSLKVFILPHALFHNTSQYKFFLSDQLCPPAENDGVVWWDAPFKTCGSKGEVDVILHNEILVNMAAYSSWVRLPLRCSRDSLGNLLKDPLNPKYAAEVCPDSDLKEQFKSPSINPKVNGSYFISVFLQKPDASDDGGKQLLLAPWFDSCKATSLGDPSNVVELISNGCPVNKMVRSNRLLEQPLFGEKQSFEFIYDDIDSSRALVISCNVSVCIRVDGLSITGLEQCSSLWKRSCQYSLPASSPVNRIVTKTHLTPQVVELNVARFNVTDVPTLGGMGSTPPFTEPSTTRRPPSGSGSTPSHGVQPSSISRPLPIAPSVNCDAALNQLGEGLVGITTVVCIAIAAFTIGVLLIGALWFIHSRTGPRKKKVNLASRCVPRSLQAKCADSNQGTLTNQVCCPGFNNA